MGRQQWVGSLLVLVLVAASGVVWLTARDVRAGDGTLTVVTKPDKTFDHARMRAKVFIDLPRSAELRRAFEEQMNAANKLVCDYTDGRFRFEQLDIVNHPLEKRNADIWWYLREDRAFAQLGTFGRGADPNAKPAPMCNGKPTIQTALGRLTIYTFNRDPTDPDLDTPQDAQTIAHELGHMIFGLGDLYADPRATLYPDGAARGAGVSGFNLNPELQTGRPFFRDAGRLPATGAPSRGPPEALS